MRIIHCADIHLDSSMTTNLDNSQAVQRRHELLITFIKMNEYAEAHQVDMILISGDLFDTEYVSQNTRQQVLATIAHYKRIQYVYIEGNHDEGIFIRNLTGKPENLHYLMNGECYELGNVTILAADHPKYVLLNPDRVNIVMMHGEPDLKAFAGRYIDYMALGHLHQFQSKVIDARGVACYSGCLEGRGFDETGKKGFVLLETGSSIDYRLIPFASRTVIDCGVNVDGCTNSSQVQERINGELERMEADCKDIVRVRLMGRVSEEFQLNKQFLIRSCEEHFFAFSIEDDQLKPQIRVEDYEDDSSLKGIFIKNVLRSQESEEYRRQIIALGLQVLCGEEPE